MSDDLESLRYPIGRPVLVDQLEPAQRQNLIGQIEELPSQLRAAVANLDENQLATPYRPEGWTVRQVLSHVGDSHMNAYLRFKWALTENNPTILPYAEAEWAKLADTASPIAETLELIDLVHRRWLRLMAAMAADDWQRTFYHPERKIRFTLDSALCMYGWHSLHHTAHIVNLRSRMGW